MRSPIGYLSCKMPSVVEVRTQNGLVLQAAF